MFALAALGLLTVASAPTTAHHTYVTKYNPAKRVNVSGIVTSVQFVNPHVFFDVQTAKGTWRVETESISVSRAKGLTQDVLKDGAKVTVSGWPARDGTAAMGLNTITLKGGKTIKMRGTAR